MLLIERIFFMENRLIIRNYKTTIHNEIIVTYRFSDYIILLKKLSQS